MAGVLNCLAMTAKNIGQDVVNGMRGDITSFTKQYGERILKSNMTKQQIKEAGERGVRDAIKTAAKKDLGEETFNKIMNSQVSKVEKNLLKKGVGTVAREAKMRGGAFGSGIEDKLIGKQLAKQSLGYQIGDMIGGGVRSAARSKKGGHDIKTALSSGFTKKVGGEIKDIGNSKFARVGGESQINLGRVAGAAFGASVAGRVVTGGGLYRDRYGRVNVPGVPFI